MGSSCVGPYSLTRRLSLIEIIPRRCCGEARLPLQVWADLPSGILTLPSPQPYKDPKLQGTGMAAPPLTRGWGPLDSLSSLLYSRGLWGLERPVGLEREDMPRERRCLVLWMGAQHLRAQSHLGKVCRGWGW